jgi:hypothetical protein
MRSQISGSIEEVGPSSPEETADAARYERSVEEDSAEECFKVVGIRGGFKEYKTGRWGLMMR